jgi:hypothetical protein
MNSHFPTNHHGDNMTEMVITPVKIENRLYELSHEIDEAHEQLSKAEMDYHKAKSAFELSIARARILTGNASAKMRVQDIADHALLQCYDEFQSLQITEAMVKAARANAQRIRTQVDIARSIGTSVRASMDI